MLAVWDQFDNPTCFTFLSSFDRQVAEYKENEETAPKSHQIIIISVSCNLFVY